MKRRTLLALPSLVVPAAFLAGTRVSAQTATPTRISARITIAPLRRVIAPISLT